MVKYSEEFMVKIVLEYSDSRLGYATLAKKYGVEGLMRKKNHEVYSVQFKLDVLSFMKRTGASLAETKLHFDLASPSMISSWKKKFLEGGAEALDQQKGRPAMSDKAKEIKPRTEPAPQDAMTREQNLERGNELLPLN